MNTWQTVLFALILVMALNDSDLQSQHFMEQPSFNDFSSIGDGDFQFVDLNGDGQVDIISTMATFLNDGSGRFKEVWPQPFTKLIFPALAIGDINGDNFPDVFITGRIKSKRLVARLYTNDGQGRFTEVQDTVLRGVEYGAAAIADVNGDGLGDLIVAGREERGRHTRLYLNRGNLQFERQADTLFPGVDHGALVIRDLNGDGHRDVLLCGDTGLLLTTKGKIQDLALISKIYWNDGQGKFREDASNKFTGLTNGAIAIEDINKDARPDIIVTGKKYLGPNVTHLYLNQGEGGFSKSKQTDLIGISQGDMAIHDFDEDGELDLLLVGEKSWGKGRVKLLSGNGKGNFTEIKDHDFMVLARPHLAVADTDGDERPEVMIAGRAGFLYAKLYHNLGRSRYEALVERPFVNVRYPSLGIGDMNGDDHPDIVLSGTNGFGTRSGGLYHGSDSGNFVPITSPIEWIGNGAYSFSDFDGDGLVDMLAVGANRKGKPTTKLYYQDSEGIFSADTTQFFVGIEKGAAATADVNGDGRMDFFVTGQVNYRDGVSMLYLNQGEGRFEIDQASAFDSLTLGAVAMGDLNGDDFPDIMLTGRDKKLNPITSMYWNDGAGRFTIQSNAGFVGVQNGNITLADMNQDGALDVLINGGIPFQKDRACLYMNDGFGSFKEVNDTPFEGTDYGSLSVDDVNGDSLPDVLITGLNDDRAGISKLYLNQGSGNFQEVIDPDLPGIKYSIGRLADFNSDGLPDILLAGSDGARPITRWYINTGKW